MFGKKARFLSRPDAAAPNEENGTSLELLYRHHYTWLLGQVRRRFGADQAEDIVQEAYLRAAAYQGREVRSPRALLLQIATNAAIDRQRRAAVRPAIVGVEESDGATPEHQAQALVLKQLILSLPPHLKEVFVLSRFGGLTYEEIAEHLGIAMKTVEWRMTKALKVLSKRLHD